MIGIPMLNPSFITGKISTLPVIVFASVAIISTYQLRDAKAQQYSANSGWGVASVGSANSGDSATMHTQYGVVAGQVEAAERGILLSTGSSTIIQVIGSQSIVSTEITGNNNDVSQEANQDTTNSGNQQYQ